MGEFINSESSEAAVGVISSDRAGDNSDYVLNEGAVKQALKYFKLPDDVRLQIIGTTPGDQRKSETIAGIFTQEEGEEDEMFGCKYHYLPVLPPRRRRPSHLPTSEVDAAAKKLKEANKSAAGLLYDIANEYNGNAELKDEEEKKHARESRLKKAAGWLGAQALNVSTSTLVVAGAKEQLDSPYWASPWVVALTGLTFYAGYKWSNHVTKNDEFRVRTELKQRQEKINTVVYKHDLIINKQLAEPE